MTPGSGAQHTTALRRFARTNFSPAFVYPLKGVWYFITHRYLHPLLKGRMVPLAVVTTSVLAILFLALYLPIVVFLSIFHYKGSAWVNATFILLELGSLVVAIVFEAMLVDHTQVDIFDAVMIAEGYEGLVRSKRLVSEDIDESDPVKRLGGREKGACFAPFSFRQIIEFFILLPLNFVPFAGVPLFLLLTGYRAGPLLAWRYFNLKGMTKRERNAFITTKERRWEYMWFGTVYMTLQLLPILSMLFLLSSAAGSALWSVHLEREGQVIEEGWEGDDDRAPTRYTDDPA